MEYTALWGPKGFIVSPTKIVPLLDLETSFALKSDSGNDTSGTATINGKGREPQTVTLSTLYVRGAGVDPRGQINEWREQVGNAYPMYIEGKRFGPPKLMLKSVDVSEIKLSNTGKFLQCAVTLEFEEYANQSSTKKVYKSSAEEKNTALKATATPADRASHKPTITKVMVHL